MTTDIAAKSFWDKIPFLKPYALLARWDRPIGVWLLYWPCVWGLALAPGFKTLPPLQQISLLVLFFIGAVAMRGAGCVVNDITDRDLDKHVERTKARPLASGQVSIKQALVFTALQCVIGAAVLFHLSPLAIYLGLATLPLIVAYPFMKRITWWPQAFLGIIFNSGALIGWAVVENSITLPALLLYVSGFFWTLAYDTVYAHMDAEDDALVGIKSTALRWGMYSKTIVGICFVVCIVLFAATLILTKAPSVGFVMLAIAAAIMMMGHSFWDPLNKAYSLGFFRLQAKIGLLLALAALASIVF